MDVEVQEGVIIEAPGGQGKGVVRYVGTTKFKDGIWVGLEFEGPKGKNNGEVQGVRYFSCAGIYA
jgi:dynactin complex subunit